MNRRLAGRRFPFDSAVEAASSRKRVSVCGPPPARLPFSCTLSSGCLTRSAGSRSQTVVLQAEGEVIPDMSADRGGVSGSSVKPYFACPMGDLGNFSPHNTIVWHRACLQNPLARFALLSGYRRRMNCPWCRFRMCALRWPPLSPALSRRGGRGGATAMVRQEVVLAGRWACDRGRAVAGEGLQGGEGGDHAVDLLGGVSGADAQAQQAASVG